MIAMSSARKILLDPSRPICYIRIPMPNTIKDGWVAADIPANEEERLLELSRYQILDTDATNNFDNITQIVRDVFQTRYALVSLIDPS